MHLSEAANRVIEATLAPPSRFCAVSIGLAESDRWALLVFSKNWLRFLRAASAGKGRSN